MSLSGRQGAGDAAVTLSATLRLWLPNAISVSLLNLELPVISLILAASILAGETRPMSRTSLLRVLISTLGCYLLVQQEWPVDLAAITALVAAAWLESLLLALLLWRRERRARLLRANRLGPIHLSVPLALLTPLLLFHLLVIPNPGMLISLLIFALPIALELGGYLLTPCYPLPWQEKTEGA